MNSCSMNSGSDAPEALSRHVLQGLTRQQNAARQLLAALQAEAQQLQTLADSESLCASTREKLACVQELEATAAAFKGVRDQTLSAMGYWPDETGWTQALGEQPGWAHGFQTLQALLEQARQLNAQNGVALQTCLRHTRHALLDLQQRVQKSQPLYTATGRMSGFSAPTALTRAAG